MYNNFLIFIYFVPFFYCVYLSLINKENLYEKQLVWYYIVLYIPVFITYYLCKYKLK